MTIDSFKKRAAKTPKDLDRKQKKRDMPASQEYIDLICKFSEKVKDGDVNEKAY